MFSGHAESRHEFADLAGGVTGGEPGQGFGEPRLRVDAVELAALDEGGDDGPVVAALVGAGEERVLAIESERADRSFDGVGVEIDATIFEEADQAVPATERTRMASPSLLLRLTWRSRA